MRVLLIKTTLIFILTENPQHESRIIFITPEYFYLLLVVPFSNIFEYLYTTQPLRSKN